MCESCYLYIDKWFHENCNEYCSFNHPYYSGRCHCPVWRYGDCCENCRHINIDHCKPGKQMCGGNPDNIKCTQCYYPYYSAGYGNGCHEMTQNLTLQLNHNPGKDLDLINNSVTLRCSTGCVFPVPSIIWYYSQMTGSLSVWSSSQNVTDLQGRCNKFEKMYTSTLVLPKYTVFDDNVDKTVRFQCGATILNGTTEEVLTEASVDVRFAVKVTEVSLWKGRHNVSNVSSLNVIDGIMETFTCITSKSRPLPTIKWFIGVKQAKKVVGTESTFAFIPNITDNGLSVYCRAFNIQSENEAVSSNKVILRVKERATVSLFYVEDYVGETNVTVDENYANLQLKCNISCSSAKIVKIKFGEKILTEKANTNQISFTREHVSCFHSGEYTCEGEDQFGVKTVKTLNVFVNCSPRPGRQEFSSILCSLGQPITLQFTAMAFPEPSIDGFKWYKEISNEWSQLLDNIDLHITVSGFKTTLEIFNITRANLGRYRLTIENVIGTYYTYYSLIEKEETSVNVDIETTHRNNFKTATIILGIISVIGIGSSAVIGILYRRLNNKTDMFSNMSSKKSFDTASDDVKTQETCRNVYENLPKQYEDLKSCPRDNMTTYDALEDTI